MRSNERLWPRALAHLVKNGPATCADIGAALGEDPKSVYASFSSMGARKGRRWIHPVPNSPTYWRRSSPFAITPQGKKALDAVSHA